MNNLLRHIIPTVQFLKKYKYFFISIFSVFTIAFIISCSSSVDRNYGLRDRSIDADVTEPSDNDDDDRRSSRRSNRRRGRGRGRSYERPEKTDTCDTTCEIALWCDTPSNSAIAECKTLVTADDINTIKDIFSSDSNDYPLIDSDEDKLLAIGDSGDDRLRDQNYIFRVYLDIYGGLLPNIIAGASKERAGAIIYFLSRSSAGTEHSYTTALLEHTAKTNPNENLDIVNALLKRATVDEIPNADDEFPRNVDNFGSKKYDAIVIASEDITRQILRAATNDNTIVRRYSLHKNDHGNPRGSTIKKVDMRNNPDLQEEYKRFFKNTDGTTGKVETDIFSLNRNNHEFLELAYNTLERICDPLVQGGFSLGSANTGKHNYCIRFVTCWSLENSQGSTDDDSYPLTSGVDGIVDADFPVPRIPGNAAAVNAIAAANAAEAANNFLTAVDDTATSFSDGIKTAVAVANRHVAATSFSNGIKTAVDDAAVLVQNANDNTKVVAAKEAFNDAAVNAIAAANTFTVTSNTVANSCRLWRYNNDSTP